MDLNSLDLSLTSRRLNLAKFKTEVLELLAYLLADLLTRRNHQSDFDHTRADYIRKRLSVLLLTVSPILILWLIADYQLLNRDAFNSIATIRVGAAVILLAIAYWTYSTQDLTRCQFALGLTLLVFNGFYLLSQVILNDAGSPEANFGYSLFPFLYMSMLTIFPLTALESLMFASIMAASVASAHLIRNSFFSFDALGDFWFLSLLFLIVLWAQMAQLHMLMRLYRQATRDPLTGLLNRRKLMDRMEQAVATSVAANKPAIMLLFDLDHFKRINDTHGHQSGDRVLQAFAKLLESNMRDTDSIGRYGGEEFVCMLPFTPTELGIKIAERIRRACASQLVMSTDGLEIPFTTSIGVARYRPSENLSTFIDRADESLYEAKREGRNRVVLTAA